LSNPDGIGYDISQLVLNIENNSSGEEAVPMSEHERTELTKNMDSILKGYAYIKNVSSGRGEAGASATFTLFKIMRQAKDNGFSSEENKTITDAAMSWIRESFGDDRVSLVFEKSLDKQRNGLYDKDLDSPMADYGG